MAERYVKRVLTQQDIERIRIDLTLNPDKWSNDPCCDFCSDPHPIVIYSAKRMSTGEVKKVNRWCACEKCDMAIERGDWDEIKRRVLRRIRQIAERRYVTETPNLVEGLTTGVEIALADFRRNVETEVMPAVGQKIHGFTAEYINAMEQRLRWLKWCLSGESAGLDPYSRTGDASNIPTMYYNTLSQGDTFFMNAKFCQLVDLARHTIPDDTKFEMDWLLAKQGWMFIAEPFRVPSLDYRFIVNKDMPEEQAKEVTQIPSRISAIGWGVVEEAHSVEIMCFQDLDLWQRDVSERLPHRFKYKPKQGFNTWSFFGLRDGDVLLDRIRDFESRSGSGADGGSYLQDRSADMLHEIRWVYTAFHMMAQRLRQTVRVEADRKTRRRMEREPKQVQIPPFIQVITLRKLEADRQEHIEKGGNPIDWQWQWSVVGHWRKQWYPSENIHKPKWIESYIKGPDDKPLKPPQHKIFVARR